VIVEGSVGVIGELECIPFSVTQKYTSTPNWQGDPISSVENEPSN